MFDLVLNTGARYRSGLLPAVGMAAALLAGPSCAPEPAEAPGWARTALLDSRVRELESRRHPAREASVRIPALASDAVELHDRGSAVSIAVALAGADPVAGTRSGPFVYYPAALGDDVDYVVVERPDGFEDFVLYHEPPPEETARFSLDVTGVPGLRLVGGVLELLDESGTPRLRARPPYLVDARGARIDATVALEGCDADRDPRAPWGRPVVAPGAERCTLIIRWGATFGQAVSYPAVLDPWMTTGSMVFPRFGHTATLLADGRVLVIGHGNQVVAVAELYDPGTGTWAVTGPTLEVRRDHTATRLADGRVLIVGGRHPQTTQFYGGAEIYDAATGVFTPAGKMQSARAGHGATLLGDGRVLVAGGIEYGVIFGGVIYNAVFLTESELYDPSGGTWETGPAHEAPHAFATLTTLPDGDALLVGGNQSGLAERFDGGTWQTWGAVAPPRARHDALALSDGRVALVRGAVESVALLTTELFDPAAAPSAAWGSFSAMQRGHDDGAAALLADDRILVLAGDENGDAEIYQPSSDSWLLVEPFSTDEVSGLSATSLDPYTVLVAGGQIPVQQTTDEAWLFTLVAAGSPCSHDGECVSAHCADGVCCDSVCDAPCHACTARKKGGGEDGTCAAVADGSADPRGLCIDEGPCGQNGLCGSGSCAYYGAETSCTTATCPAAGASCNANGACECVTAACSEDGSHFGSADCAPYRCNADGCLTTCATSAECVAGHLCDRNGRCSLPAATPPVDDGGCSSARGSSPSSWLVMLLLSLGAGLRRRVIRRVCRKRLGVSAALVLLYVSACADDAPPLGGTGAAAGSGGSAGEIGSGGAPAGGTAGAGGEGGAAGEGGAGGEAPTWYCDPAWYGTADGCDCGCGILDPDCADATVASCENCNRVGSCGTGACPANIDPLDNAKCLAPVCGNERIDTDESCDDGNVLRGDGCGPSCQLELPPPAWTCLKTLWGPGNGCNCGCGIRDIACIDATIESCSDNCQNNLNGSCNPLDPCAASTLYPTDNATCTTCGDGIVDFPAEWCDDGNTLPGDGCALSCWYAPPNAWTCNPEYWQGQDGCDCGCGVVDPDCADDTAASCDFCGDVGSCGTSPACPANINAANSATCTACGNSTVDPGEECDDGNTVGGDGCGANCQYQPPPEWICHPDYYHAADGCDCGCGAIDPDCADATVASCFYCHDAGACGTGTCPANIDPLNNASCTPPVCGNGVLDEIEQCDDGNTTGADGCNGSCKLEWTCSPWLYDDGNVCDCGCGAIDPDCGGLTIANCETCNRAGSCNTDPCPGIIEPANIATCIDCGNGSIDPGEECDDGNNLSSDGCSANCKTEGGPVWTCDQTFYGGMDGCDCGCGIVDPDCADATVASCAWCDDPGSCGTGLCPANIDPLNNAVCLTWTCDPTFFGAMDGCDCGCGIFDPDCADTTAASCDYCDDPGSCGTGLCPANIDPMNNTTCI